MTNDRPPRGGSGSIAGVRRPLLLMALAGFIALALALTAIGSGGAYRTHHHGPSAGATTDLSALWAVPPVEVAGLLILAALYAWQAHRAGGVSRLRQTSFHAGIVVLLIAVSSPLGGVAQQGLLTAHMLQHTMIGAIAPLLMLLGMPRAFLEATLGAGARRAIGRLQHPAVGFPLWAASTVAWLLPAVHRAVLENGALWIVQQVSLLAVGLLLWAPVVEAIPAPAWFGTGVKCAYMAGVFFVGLAIANVYWFSGTPFYPSHAAAAEAWGLEPLEDQADAGTVMMVLHCLLAFGAIGFLFFRQAREGDLRQRLIEAGVDPARVAEATRAGTAESLARLHGVSARSRAGID